MIYKFFTKDGKKENASSKMIKTPRCTYKTHFCTTDNKYMDDLVEDYKSLFYQSQ